MILSHEVAPPSAFSDGTQISGSHPFTPGPVFPTASQVVQRGDVHPPLTVSRDEPCHLLHIPTSIPTQSAPSPSQSTHPTPRQEKDLKPDRSSHPPAWTCQWFPVSKVPDITSLGGSCLRFWTVGPPLTSLSVFQALMHKAEGFLNTGSLFLLVQSCLGCLKQKRPVFKSAHLRPSLPNLFQSCPGWRVKWVAGLCVSVHLILFYTSQSLTTCPSLCSNQAKQCSLTKASFLFASKMLGTEQVLTSICLTEFKSSVTSRNLSFERWNETRDSILFTSNTEQASI